MKIQHNKDSYWALSSTAIFKITKTGTERFVLPYTIVPNDWKIVVSPDHHVILSTIKSGKPRLLYVNEKTKAISTIKVVNREELEDTSAFSDVFFTGNNFYLFNRKSAFRFNLLQELLNGILISITHQISNIHFLPIFHLLRETTTPATGTRPAQRARRTEAVARA